ncbi:GTPase HflX [Spirochaetia bacterium]|nr:GTPase HflX [Spirochaetia bacterium]
METEEKPKRAFLVGIRDGKTSKIESESLTGELAGLAETLGLEIAGGETVHIREHTAQYGMGTGKAEELAAKAAELAVDCIVFDRDISPSQQRNWEKLCKVAAVDRQELIIQIFAGRAKTREAELQVALAELAYSLPRLSHKYIDLSRQRGGRYGTKGSGETRLETDRRLVLQRIQQLKGELEDVRKQRSVQRQRREKAAIPSCALVGYTNAGKSSLLNALTLSSHKAGSPGAFVEDKLFATLDASVRRMETEQGRPLLLVDTVGFIRRLPHSLVDAFRSTLEEAALSDILLHVIDASDPSAEQYYTTTMEVLRDLGADQSPMIIVLNKIDRIGGAGEGIHEVKAGEEGERNREMGEGQITALQAKFPGSIPVSAKDGTGLEELKRRIGLLVSDSRLRFRFPLDRHDLPALLYRSGTVLSESYDDTGITVEARVEKRVAEMLREFVAEA